MLLFGVSAPQFGHRRGGGHMYGHSLMGLGATSCDTDADCSGNQTCNADSGQCEDPSGVTYGCTNCSGTCVAGSCIEDSTGGIGCGPGTHYDINKGQCIPNATGSSSSTTSWWQSALTAVGAGAATALKPSTAAAKLPAATPWYQSPIGIGAIAIGVIGLVMLLKK